jgi:hypothetical protein
MKAMEKTERAGVDKNPNQSEIDRYIKKTSSESRTPLWMAHKSADEASSDHMSMKQANAEDLAIPPYKESEKTNRENLVQRLHILEKQSKSGSPTLDETYSPHRMGKEHIVVSNRGCFIIADNYCYKPENNDDQLILTVEGQEFPFGGKDGAFQYKLKEGDIFSLTKGTETKTFQYENNEIKCIYKT